MERRFSLGQVAAVAVVFSAIISGLTYWLTYGARPRVLYDQTEVEIPARPAASPGFVGAFLQLRFVNIGGTPAHGFHLLITATSPIDYPDLNPTLSGDDELRVSLSEDKRRADVVARRLPPKVIATLRLWLTDEGKMDSVRFMSEELGEASKVDSLEAAIAPWYQSTTIALLGASLLFGLLVGWFVPELLSRFHQSPRS